MRRRQFITLVGGAAGRMTAWREQQSKNIPAVGVLWHAGSAEETNDQIVCYDAITALTERFCQNAPRPEANGGQVPGLATCGSNLAADQLLLPRPWGSAEANSASTRWHCGGIATDELGSRRRSYWFAGCRFWELF
jgi:hypothetical protein